MKRQMIYKISSYMLIYIIFISMGFYLETNLYSPLFFSTLLSFMLHIVSSILERSVIDFNGLKAIRALIYSNVLLFVLVFVFINYNRVCLVESIIASTIGSASIIGFLVAISNTGRNRHEIR